jgi:hypothetical protein
MTDRRSLGPNRRAAVGARTVAAVAALLVGLVVAAYGVLLLSVSPLGGLHVAAIGLSLAAAGAFATDPVSRRLGLSDRTRGALSLGFAGLAGLLAVAFVVLNAATFEGPFVESGSESAGAALRPAVAGVR